MKDLIVEYELNEDVFVIHHVLDGLYQKFCSGIPKEIADKMLDLVVITQEDYNLGDVCPTNYDGIEDNFIRRVKLEQVNKKKN